MRPAELDNIRRLRVLAEANRAMYAEDLVPAPYAIVWAAASDLETSLPLLLPDVRSAQIVSSEGERLEVDTRGFLGLRGDFDVVLRPGLCIMQSSRLIGGMAAVSEGEATRFAFMGAFRVPGRRVAGPLLHPITRRYGAAVIRRLRRKVS